MNPIQQQLADLARVKATVSHLALTNNTILVTVPDESLPAGWSASSTTVRFIVPVGYPMARPDCFWAESQLRLANNAMPQATNVQPIPPTTDVGLWFSWHVQKWDPNRDTLFTFLQVIRARLKEVR